MAQSRSESGASTRLRNLGRPVLSGDAKEGAVWWLANGRSMLDMSGSALVQTLIAPGRIPAPPDYANVTMSAGFDTPARIALEDDILARVSPAYTGILWASSGSDALEWAIWALHTTRTIARRPAVTAFAVREGGYHGATSLTRALSTRTRSTWSEPGVNHRVAILTESIGNVAWETSIIDQLEQLDEARSTALLLETVPTTGRRLWPGVDAYRTLLRFCRERNIAVVLDEVAAGVFRHGWFSAFDWLEDAAPEIIVIGKGLTSGTYPLSCALLRADLSDILRQSKIRMPGYTIALNDPAAVLAKSCLSRYDTLSAKGVFQRREELIGAVARELTVAQDVFRIEHTRTTIRLSTPRAADAEKLRQSLLANDLWVYSTAAEFGSGPEIYFHVCPALDLPHWFVSDSLARIVSVACECVDGHFHKREVTAAMPSH